MQRNAQRVDFEKMLKNASSLAIVGLDTAENGPSKVRQVTNRIDAIIGGAAAATNYSGQAWADAELSLIHI